MVQIHPPPPFFMKEESAVSTRCPICKCEDVFVSDRIDGFLRHLKWLHCKCNVCHFRWTEKVCLFDEETV